MQCHNKNCFWFRNKARHFEGRLTTYCTMLPLPDLWTDLSFTLLSHYLSHTRSHSKYFDQISPPPSNKTADYWNLSQPVHIFVLTLTFRCPSWIWDLISVRESAKVISTGSLQWRVCVCVCMHFSKKKRELQIVKKITNLWFLKYGKTLYIIEVRNEAILSFSSLP